MIKNKLVLVKGAGDFATGTIRRLYMVGAKVVCTELPQPLTVRRKVAFSEAVYDGEFIVDGIRAVRSKPDEIDRCLTEGKIPIVTDSEANIIQQRKFDIVIDARMAKKNLGTKITEAPIVIGLGPGFETGVDCHAVVETLAGHNLGRVIYKGKAAENTGVPLPPEVYLNPCSSYSQGVGNPDFSPCNAGFDFNDLVLRAPEEGIFFCEKQIGDLVKSGELIGKIDETDVIATADGVLRGLIHDGVIVTKGLKIGDIDPSGDVTRVNQISEKANAIAGGVLEACLYLLNKYNLEF